MTNEQLAIFLKQLLKRLEHVREHAESSIKDAIYYENPETLLQRNKLTGEIELVTVLLPYTHLENDLESYIETLTSSPHSS